MTASQAQDAQLGELIKLIVHTPQVAPTTFAWDASSRFYTIDILSLQQGRNLFK